MKRRVGIFGTSPEALCLIEPLARSPRVEVVRVFAPDATALQEDTQTLPPEVVDFVLLVGTDDFSAFTRPDDLSIVIEGSRCGEFRERAPDAVRRGVQIVSPRAAQLLWGPALGARDRKAALIEVLSEIVESVELAADSDDLFGQMLELAIEITGADGGSLMLLDDTAQDLRIRVASGVEPELWPKIRIPLGEGVAGRAALEGETLHIRGPADRERFRIVRERLDVAAALCIPLIEGGKTLGVLNLHHSTHTDAFSEVDVRFVEELAALDAQIISQAEEHAALRDQAAHYQVTRELHAIFAANSPVPTRLHTACQRVSQAVDGGITHIYLIDEGQTSLRLVGSSTAPLATRASLRVPVGLGIDGTVAQTSRPAFLQSEGGGLTYCALPLRADGERIGTLSVQGPIRGRTARTTRAFLLETSAVLAEGLAQLVREERVRERAQRLTSVHEAGGRLHAARDLPELSALATSSLAALLDAEHVVLRRCDTHDSPVLSSYSGSATQPDRARWLAADEAIARDARQRPQARLLEAPTTEPSEGANTDPTPRRCIAAALQQAGRPIGTLTAYGKRAPGLLSAETLGPDDVEIVNRFIARVEQAWPQQTTDAVCALPLPNPKWIEPSDLAERANQEITRARGRDAALAVCVVGIDAPNSRAPREDATDRSARVAKALQAASREADLLCQLAPDRFTLLLPEPGANPGDTIHELVQAVDEALTQDAAEVDGNTLGLAFGYAIHPFDGEDWDTLSRRASPPRIRTV
jgi:GAF domain-containing protein